MTVNISSVEAIGIHPIEGSARRAGADGVLRPTADTDSTNTVLRNALRQRLASLEADAGLTRGHIAALEAGVAEREGALAAEIATIEAECRQRIADAKTRVSGELVPKRNAISGYERRLEENVRERKRVFCEIQHIEYQRKFGGAR